VQPGPAAISQAAHATAPPAGGAALTQAPCPSRGAGPASAVLLVGLLVLVLLAATAAPAAAHTRAQAASSYASRIVSAPALDGVEWRMYASGDLVELVNRGPEEVLVLGYEDEPYLRVGPEGVFENRNSPATYVNADRYADVAVPPRADAAAEPDWVRVADGPARAWHDHRVHWMAPSPPQVVVESHGDVAIFEWAVPFVRDGERHLLLGELHWVEPGPWWPWLLAAVVLTAPLAVGFRRPDRGLRTLLRPAAAGVAAVALLNTIHFIDELLAWPAPTLDILFGLFHTALFVGVGLAGAAIAWRGRQGPLLSLGIASGAVLFHQGLLQLSILTSSQLPTVWPDGLLRGAVAASVGQSLWVAAVIVTARRRVPGDVVGQERAFTHQAMADHEDDVRTHKELI
jgi:hypothetical protein